MNRAITEYGHLSRQELEGMCELLKEKAENLKEQLRRSLENRVLRRQVDGIAWDEE